MPSRREFLRTGIASTLAGVAGCSGESIDSSPSTEPVTTDPTETSRPTTTVEPGTVADWIATERVPFGTTDPTDPVSEPGAIGRQLAEATVVGLGEATHGTREFFRLKHRLLRHMVKEQGCRTIAWEAGFSEMLPIDEYVRTGEGNPIAVLEEFYWAWNCRAFLSIVEWIRSFNEGRDAGDQVRFYGIDIQSGRDPARHLRRYLNNADAAILDEVSTNLQTLASDGFDDEGEQPVEERISTAETLISEIKDAFERNEQAYITATSQEGYRLARRALWELSRAQKYNAATSPEASSRIRDRSMAANVQWLLDHEATDNIVVSAHNAHIGTDPELYSVDPMGTYLRAEYNDAYYSLGFEFDHGNFRSRSMTDGDVTEFSLDTPADGTLWSILAAVDTSPFGLDFASIDHSALSNWLRRTHGVHDIGTVYDPTRSSSTVHVPLAGAFDGLMFVSDTTSTETIPEDGTDTQSSRSGDGLHPSLA
jgi:erythromycin esterase